MNIILISGRQAKPVETREGIYHLVLRIEDEEPYHIHIETDKELPLVFKGEPIITVKGKLKKRGNVNYIEAKSVSTEFISISEEIDWIQAQRAAAGYSKLTPEIMQEILNDFKNGKQNG